MPSSIPAASCRVANRRVGLGAWVKGLLAAPRRAAVRRASLGRAVAASCERLEDRQLMSVVYVSASSGNDGNKGNSTGLAVRSLARAEQLLHNGDQLLLKSGDTWGTGLGVWGWSNVTIGSYGSGARPQISTSGDGIRINRAGTGNVTIRGIRFANRGKTSACGIIALGSVNGLTIDNCEVTGFRNNIMAMGTRGSTRNIVVRNSTVTYANGNGKSQGIFCDGVSGITIENSTFDHNGGNAGSMYNHGAYITGLCSNLTVRGSTFSNSSSYGMQARCGGVIQNNKFINNSVGLSVGIVYGDGVHTDGGVTCTVTGNTFSGKASARNRGVGLELGNIKSGVVSNNKFLNGTGNIRNNAIYIGRGTAKGNQVGVRNLTISNNTASGWGGGIYTTPNAGAKNLVLSNNKL